MSLDEYLDEVLDLDGIKEMAELGLTVDDDTIKLRSQAVLYYIEIFNMAVARAYEKKVTNENKLHQQYPLQDRIKGNIS